MYKVHLHLRVSCSRKTILFSKPSLSFKSFTNTFVSNMFAKNILIGLLSLAALTTALPADITSNEVAAPAAASTKADAASPPPPPSSNRPAPGRGQSAPPGRPREPPRPRPENPRPGNGNGNGNGGRPGYDNGPRPENGGRPGGYDNAPRPGWNNGPRPGYGNGPGWPSVVPLPIPIPVLGGLGSSYNESPGEIERYCESLNVNSYQLPGCVLALCSP